MAVCGRFEGFRLFVVQRRSAKSRSAYTVHGFWRGLPWAPGSWQLRGSGTPSAARGGQRSSTSSAAEGVLLAHHAGKSVRVRGREAGADPSGRRFAVLEVEELVELI